eukprot:362952-Chlamydomonas_euryale.AAC.11
MAILPSFTQYALFRRFSGCLTAAYDCKARHALCHARMESAGERLWKAAARHAGTHARTAHVGYACVTRSGVQYKTGMQQAGMQYKLVLPCRHTAPFLANCRHGGTSKADKHTWRSLRWCMSGLTPSDPFS